VHLPEMEAAGGAIIPRTPTRLRMVYLAHTHTYCTSHGARMELVEQIGTTP